MHINTTSLLTLLFSISVSLPTISAIPTPAPAPAFRTTKDDLSYLAQLFSNNELTPNFRLRADSQFPLADPLTNKQICGRAYSRSKSKSNSEDQAATATATPQCCCMFLHTKDATGTELGISSSNGGKAGGGLGRSLGLGIELSMGRGKSRKQFWGDGPGAEDAMITCGLDEGTGICER